jgi:hypothetical protein
VKGGGLCEVYCGAIAGRGGRIGAGPITRLFNTMWKSGKFPSEWNEGVLVPVFKKGDVNECANYRTITIGPV